MDNKRKQELLKYWQELNKINRILRFMAIDHELSIKEELKRINQELEQLKDKLKQEADV